MTSTVGGGKVWVPTVSSAAPTPAQPSKISKALKVAKIGIQLLLSLGFILFIYAYTASTVEVTEEMSVGEWINLTNGASFKAVLAVGLIWFAVPAWAGIVAMIISSHLKRGLLLFVALIAVGEGFMLHAYQQGVTNADNQATISSWMEEKYGYELIDFVNSEGLANSDDRVTAFVLDNKTGEEKLVKYYDNNDIVYFAVDDDDFLQQIKQNARN